MTDLAARYGTRRSKRGLLIGISAVVVAALAGWAVWMVVYASSPEVHSDLTAFDMVDEHQIDAKITVVRDETDREATCLVRALAHDHAVVGEKTFKVDSGPKRQRMTISLRTERSATSIDLEGCSTESQSQRK